MILKNYFGTSYDFIPKKCYRYTASQVSSEISNVSYHNRIYLMDGPMPDTNVLYEINDISTFESLYQDKIVYRFLDQQLTYTYDIGKKERLIRKLPDAIDFTYNIDASIKWFAVLLEEFQEDLTNPNTPVEVSSTRYDNGSEVNLVNNTPTSFVFSDQSSHWMILDLERNVNISYLKFYSNDKNQNINFILEGSNDKVNWTELNNINRDSSNTPNGMDTTIEANDKVTTFRYVKLTVSDINNTSFYLVVNEIEIFGDTVDIFMFSDSVGVWEDEKKIITLENLNGDQGSNNILKDFTLALRDSSNIETAAMPVTEYSIDNNPGVINIDPISDGFITNIEKTKPLTISGNTIDIEDNQVVDIILDNTTYNATVENNLWSVTIDDISNLIANKTYVVKVSVRDIAGNLSTAEQSIVIADINVGPVISVPDTITLDEDNTKTVTMTIVDKDEGVASVQVNANNGTASWNEETNELTYTPNENFNGSDTITVTATDTLGAESSKDISVTVNPVNDLPIFTVESNDISTDEDKSVDIPLTLSDVEGPLTITTSMSNGTTVWNEDTSILTYTPNENFNGSDTLVITATDTDGANVTQTINITVNPVNDAPVINITDSITVDPDSLTDIAYTVTDVDNDNVNITASAKNGSVSINTDIKTISYDAPSVSGTDTITVTINDGTVDVVKTIDVTIS